MALTPTLNVIGKTASRTKLVQYKYTLTSVGISATGSEEILSNIQGKGRLVGVKATGSSTDFDISIRNKTGASASTNNEIFKVEGINLCYDESGMNVFYVNADTTYANKLYTVVKNDDGGNATGAISLELYIEVLDRA